MFKIEIRKSLSIAVFAAGLTMGSFAISQNAEARVSINYGHHGLHFNLGHHYRPYGYSRYGNGRYYRKRYRSQRYYRPHRYSYGRYGYRR